MNTRLKTFVKRRMQSITASDLNPVIVASMGRAGSTLIYDALNKGMGMARFGEETYRNGRFVRDVAWTLSKARFRNGVVYKTHDFPHDLTAAQNVRVVFTFGIPSDAARSVLGCNTKYGRAWIEEHFEHLRANGTFDQICDRDVLRFGDQLDSWTALKSIPVLGLKYESLWQSGAQQALSRFVGFPVTLPERKNRESAAMDLGEAGEKLMKTYANLDARVAAMPDIIANDKARALIDAD